MKTKFNKEINQPNQDFQGRSQNQRIKDERLNEDYGKDQEINPNIKSQQGDFSQNPTSNNFKPNSNNYIPQVAQEQQSENNFVNERFQNQPQGAERQQNQNQRSLLDQKMDQMITSPDNQPQYDNRQRQYQDNFRQSQNRVQSFNRNERVLDEQDANENQMDFTRYSRQVDDTMKRFELEQAPKTNQQELKNSRKNSDQQQSESLEQNTADSQIQY